MRIPAPGPLGSLGSLEDRATARRIREAALDRWEELRQEMADLVAAPSPA